MSRLNQALSLGLLMGMLGLLVLFSSPGFNFEESTGLDLLFKFRGTRAPPPDVVIVSMDRDSRGLLHLPPRLDEWPRYLHGELIDRLFKGGASLIAFDVIFEYSGEEADDLAFATAVERASNVILAESFQKDALTISDSSGKTASSLTLEKWVPPIPEIARGAIATAPFILPKLPVNVCRYWTYKTNGERKPTLPVVAYQFFTLNNYRKFLNLLEAVSPARSKDLPPDRKTVVAEKGIVPLIQKLKSIFSSDPSIGKRMLKKLGTASASEIDFKTRRQLESAIAFYQETSNSRYLNFYGPPGAIKTIPYHQLLLEDKEPNNYPVKSDVKDKAVFVGLSELVRVDQRDGFYTVFTGSKGIDISGVEIAATAFSNFLENMPIRPLDSLLCAIVVLIWGMGTGLLSIFLPTEGGAIGLIAAGSIYAAVSLLLFSRSGIWVPVAVPLMIQMPLAFITALIWKYVISNKERHKIRKIFGYYLPGNVVDQIVNQDHPGSAESQTVYSVCLFADAVQYTRISERMNPKELRNFMNQYYETIFQPVRQHGGIISDVIGDAMLALWVNVQSQDPTMTDRACRAALEIAAALKIFNASDRHPPMSVRIGLHSGRLSIGNVGGIDHYEYRPVGEVVNTASRVEGLNKHLGTQILATRLIPNPDDGMIWRRLGEFLLAGKSKSTVIYELMGRQNPHHENRDIIALFAEALELYRQRNWDRAIELFNRILSICEDGPSRFYLDSCIQYKRNPPDDDWCGMVCMTVK